MSDDMGSGSGSMKVPGPKLYGGGPSFVTGPARQKPHPFQNKEHRGASTIPATGPSAKLAGGDIGHNAKGTSVTGTKGDEAGEDKAGSSYATKGKVKGS